MNSYYEKTLATGAVRCIDDEIPFDIPQGWEWERWGNVSFSIQYGYNAPAIENGDVRMVRISDIQDNKVLWQGVPFCNIAAQEIPNYILEPNDILFARTGGTVGKSFLVESVPVKAIYAGYLIRTRYSNELSPLYLKSFMESSLYWEQLRTGTIATAQPNCNGKTLGKMLLPIPPKDEQKRIVSKLTELTSLIENYRVVEFSFRKLNDSINESLKKSILQEAIQGRLVPQIKSEGTAEDLLEEIRAEKKRLIKEGGKLKKSAIANESRIFRGDDNRYHQNINGEDIIIDDFLPFEIPSTWRWISLGELVADRTGLSYKKENLSDRTEPFIRVLRGGNIEDGELMMKADDVFISSSYVAPDLLLKKGQYISPAVSSLEKIGKTAIIMKDYKDTVVGGFVLMLLPLFDDEWLGQYLYYFFQTGYYHNYCRTITKKSGQAFYNLSRPKLKLCPVPLPPKQEIARIVERLNIALAGIMSR